jgi:hypothetical protein
MQVCPGFSGDPMEKQAFVGGCIQTCSQQMALIALTDPSDCQATIATLSGVSVEFADLCTNGF